MQKEGDEENEESRKTLKQQLSENRARRFQEYQSRVQSKNSTFLLDEKAARFYEGLRQKELEKEELAKQRRALEQRRAQQAKEQQRALAKKKSLGIGKPSKTIRILKKPRTVNDDNKVAARAESKDEEEVSKPTTSSIVSGYSSSDEDDD
ncbi:hypothetical protein Cantr_04993 [Candida viswanathii]|uniref:FAM192A/Fyv6 N-terminal domain-containing protein n=1 Tax=Candida viswanathii TaxID=5486 RepID=A0A367XRB6_9ASCO|nr:hypothetical protein Cantr_04993 [Candida viswanathii]